MSTRLEDMFELYPIDEVLRIEQVHAIYYSELHKTHVFEGESHNFWEFIYVDTGYVVGRIGDNNFFMEKGQGALIEPNVFHSLYGNGKVASNIFNFSFVCHNNNLLPLKNSVKSLSPFQVKILKLLMSILQIDPSNLYKVNLYPAKDGDTIAEYGQQQMLVRLIELLMIDWIRSTDSLHKAQTPFITEKESVSGQGVEKIVLFINSNINQKLDLPMVCRATGYSPDRVRQLVKTHYGVNLKQLVNMLKIDRAKTLLRESEMNISQISDFLGYSTVSYFSDTFYRIAGIRPNDYITSIKS